MFPQQQRQPRESYSPTRSIRNRVACRSSERRLGCGSRTNSGHVSTQLERSNRTTSRKLPGRKLQATDRSRALSIPRLRYQAEEESRRSRRSRCRREEQETTARDLTTHVPGNAEQQAALLVCACLTLYPRKDTTVLPSMLCGQAGQVRTAKQPFHNYQHHTSDETSSRACRLPSVQLFQQAQATSQPSFHTAAHLTNC